MKKKSFDAPGELRNEDRLSWKNLKPLALWLRNSKEAKERKAWGLLMKFVCKECGRPINRSNMEKWLTISDNVRVIPKFGMGLVLMRARKKFVGK